MKIQPIHKIKWFKWFIWCCKTSWCYWNDEPPLWFKVCFLWKSIHYIMHKDVV